MQRPSNVELFHQEALQRVPFVGGEMADRVQANAERVAATQQQQEYYPPVAVIVQTYANDVESLPGFLEELQAQDYPEEQVSVLIANHSSRDIAQNIDLGPNRAIMHIAPNSSEPNGYSLAAVMNLVMEFIEMASSETDLFLSSVSHARFSSNQVLTAAALASREEGFGCAYGTSLPAANASWSERIGAVLLGANRRLDPTDGLIVSDYTGLGAGAFESSAWSKTALQLAMSQGEHRFFDEQYAAGGADGNAVRLLLEGGYGVYQESAMSMLHTHGLNPLQTIRQALYWRQLNTPGELASPDSQHFAYDFCRDPQSKNRIA